MKNVTVIKYMLLPVILMMTYIASGQARLVLNGAHLVITNNATLVVDNDSSNAITRIDGSIISEGEGNIVQWMIGETIGTYTVPWSNNTTYFPLTFTKSAGSGDGHFIFSTYPTPPQNSLNLPTGVTNLNRRGTDQSYNFIDRFWQLNALGYATKPSLTNVEFGYIDAEHVEPNMIGELALGAVRWNDITNTWDGFGPAGEAYPTTNMVTVNNIESSNLYNWWSLTSEIYILTVRFLSFSARRQGNLVRLVWKTTDEVDVHEFEVQRSVHGNAFIAIGRTPAYGMNGPSVYEFTDASPVQGINTYRIKEVKKGGAFNYSETRPIEMDNKPGGVAIYPNPVIGNSFTINATGIPAGTYHLQLYGLKGTLVASFVKVLGENHVMVRLDKSLPKGMYLLKLTGGGNTFSTHVMMLGK